MKRRTIIAAAATTLLVAATLIMLPSNLEPTRPGLATFLKDKTFVNEEVLPVVDVRIAGRLIPMTNPTRRSYVVQKRMDDVIAEAKTVFSKKSGWFEGAPGLSGNSHFFTYNDLEKKNPLPWRSSETPYSYVMVTIEPGRAKKIRENVAFELKPENEPWTTITIADDGHALTEFEKALPRRPSQPRKSGYMTVLMPSP